MEYVKRMKSTCRRTIALTSQYENDTFYAVKRAKARMTDSSGGLMKVVRRTIEYVSASGIISGFSMFII